MCGNRQARCTHAFVCICGHVCTSINNAHSQGSRSLCDDFKKPISHTHLFVCFF